MKKISKLSIIVLMITLSNSFNSGLLAQNEKYLNWNALSPALDPILVRYQNLQESFKSLNQEDRTILLSNLGKLCPPRENYRTMNLQELSELNQSGTTLLTCRSLSKITERQEGSMRCRRRWTL